jgi:hypothetical protein
VAIPVAWVASAILSATAFLRKQPKRPLSGTIDLAKQTVDVCTTNPDYCARHQKKSAGVNASLTSYLRGEGPAPRGHRKAYLVSQIDRVRDQMRLRPLTQTESVAWGQQTPASKALAAYLPGGRTGGRRRKKKRVAKRKSARRVRRSPRRRSRVTRRKARGARLVKGSRAARAWGRKMRRLRGRR